MSFTDPQSITIDTVTTSLPRVSQVGQTSKYRSADGTITLTASHQEGKRKRSVIRLDQIEFGVSDPYTGLTGDQSASMYLVIDRPKNSAVFDAAFSLNTWVGFDALLNASSDLAITKLVAGES